MKIYSVLAGEFKLDGGAMFGVVPKTLWNTSQIADQNNLIDLAMRCLLIEKGDRFILIDTGIGNKLPPKTSKYYYINPNINLTHSLHKLGFAAKDITDVILSHLHLDHAGGATYNSEANELLPTFPNATYWTNKQQWRWATEHPNRRERVSFLAGNLRPLEKHHCLKYITTTDKSTTFTEDIEIFFSNGHTQSMMMPLIKYKNRKVLFAADLLPTIHHIPIAYIPAYDINPLVSMEEKEEVLTMAVKENYILFLDHDVKHECCTLRHSEKGIQLQNASSLNNALA